MRNGMLGQIHALLTEAAARDCFDPSTGGCVETA